jgi:transcriptional regulator with XRE-family HTH domain
MSQKDKQKLAPLEALGDALDVGKMRVGNYQRFTAEPQPDRYAAKPAPSSGWNAEELAELCGVSVATARRWKAGTSRIPALAAACLAMGLVHVIRNWPGWKFTADAFISPDGLRINRNDALSVPYLLASIAAKDARIAELENLTDGQPAPGEFPSKVDKPIVA